MSSATCSVCSSKLTKIRGETDQDKIEDCRNPNAPKGSLHEENILVRGDIWTSAGTDAPTRWGINDRIIHRWQSYAGRYSEKTIERHLAAIRFFEECLGGKSFATLTTDDFAAVRDVIKGRSDRSKPDSMSASTIKHHISHIRDFFDWLMKQDGYRRLPADFDGYLKLPKAVLAKSAQVKQKEFPYIEEAEALLHAMPIKTLSEKRARAIFAVAFLGALRADTLISLRLKHVDRERRLINQDASEVRAKAGKSMLIRWFPIPLAFEQAVLEWIDLLGRLGFEGDDALFPDTMHLKHRFRKGIPVMTTTHAVTDAFARACKTSATKYTPHAARHTIAAERDRRPLSAEERKAWSENMGHDNEQTTEIHYATMSQERRLEVMEDLGNKKTLDVRTLSESEKAKLFDQFVKVIGF